MSDRLRLRLDHLPSINGWIRITLALVLAVGAFLRLHHLGYDSLWLDEIDEATTAALPLKQMFNAITWAASPPLDYTVLHFLLLLGRSDTLIRLPAALYSIAAIYLVFRAGRVMYSPSAGIGASILLTFSLTSITYAQEGRMYSLFALLSCVEIMCWAFIVQKPLSWTGWIAATITGVLLMYTHYFSMLILVGLGLLWLVITVINREHTALFIRGTISFLCIGIAFALWIPSLLIQSQHHGGAISHALPHNQFWSTMLYFLGGSVSLPFQTTYFILFIIGLLHVVWKRPRMAGLLVASTVLPVVLAYGIPPVAAIVTPRNMLFALPGYLIGISIGLSELLELVIRLAKRAQPRLVVSSLSFLSTVVAAIVLSLGPSVHALAASYTKGLGGKAELRQASEMLKRSFQPGDLVLTNDRRTRFLLSYYLDPDAIRGTSFDPFIQNYASIVSGQDRPIPLLTLEAPLPMLWSAIAKAGTVWVIYPDPQALARIDVHKSREAPALVGLNVPALQFQGGNPRDHVLISAQDKQAAFTKGWSDRVYLLDEQPVRWMAPTSSLHVPVQSKQANQLVLKVFVPRAGTVNISVQARELPAFPVAAGWQSINVTVPHDLLAQNASLDVELQTNVGAPVHSSLLIGTTGVRAPVSIIGDSSGVEGQSFGDIYIGAKRYDWNEAGKGYGRGYNLLALDPQQGTVRDWQVFDTDNDPNESDRMHTFITKLPAGTIVAGVVKEDGSAHLTATGVEALQMIGCRVDIRGHFRAAHACIGVKGSPPGTAQEGGSVLSSNTSAVVGDDFRNYSLAVTSIALEEPE